MRWLRAALHLNGQCTAVISYVQSCSAFDHVSLVLSRNDIIDGSEKGEIDIPSPRSNSVIPPVDRRSTEELNRNFTDFPADVVPDAKWFVLKRKGL